MEITAEQLRSRYASRPTEELVALLAQGGLTPEAEEALRAELRARDCVDRDGKLRVNTAPTEALGSGEAKDGVRPFVRAHAGRFAPAIVFLLFAGFHIGIAALAPFIWRSPADRVCQKAGYWYATDTKWREVSCFRWGSKEIIANPL
jgi:hypothetical protein